MNQVLDDKTLKKFKINIKIFYKNKKRRVYFNSPLLIYLPLFQFVFP